MTKSPNSDLQQSFTVAQVAEKHGWPEPLVWALKLDGENDTTKCKELQWGKQTWDRWNWTDCDKKFGDEWPGRIPAQLIAHILYVFSKQNDLVINPMSPERFQANVVAVIQKKKILGALRYINHFQ